VDVLAPHEVWFRWPNAIRVKGGWLSYVNLGDSLSRKPLRPWESLRRWLSAIENCQGMLILAS
jgi:hypothetical protein